MYIEQKDENIMVIDKWKTHQVKFIQDERLLEGAWAIEEKMV